MLTSGRYVFAYGHNYCKDLLVLCSKERAAQRRRCIRFPFSIDPKLKRSYSSQKSLADVVKRYRGKSSAKTCYLINGDIADEIAEKVVQNKNFSDSIIIENSPGPGVLTKALLDRREVHQYVCTEKEASFHPLLKEIAEQREKPVKICDFDLLHHNIENNESTIATDLQRKQDSQRPLTVINMIYPQTVNINSTTNKLAERLVTDDSLYRLHPTEFFFLSPPHLLRKIMDATDTSYAIPKINYTMVSVLFNIAFDTKLIMKVPTTAFAPVYPKTKVRLKEFKFAGEIISNDHVYLLHALPNKKFQRVFTEKMLHNFKIFVGQLLRHGVSKGMLVARMEELIPICGLKLLALGYTMTQKSKDLSPHDILRVFMEALSWSEFAESPLRALFDGDFMDSGEDGDQEPPVRSDATTCSPVSENLQPQTESDQEIPDPTYVKPNLETKTKPIVKSKKSKFL